MHSRPMDDAEGTFTDWRVALSNGQPWPCSHCGGTPVIFRIWASHCGAYEDLNYHCQTCGRTWWVESDDG